jgi:uncharacterized SAM-binding protein YcdF (DUF218 family)
MIDLFLRQILLLLEPVGLLWLGLIVLTVILLRRRQRGPGIFCAVLLAFLTVLGGTDLPERLLRGMEQPWAGVKITELPECDAVVVLGGGAEPSWHDAGGVHLTKAGDRIVMGLELMRLGKAPVLVISGGTTKLGGEVKIEADAVKAWLEARSLPPAGEVVSLGALANTREEAVRLQSIHRQHLWKKILLVTSANHMRRAVAVFRAVGIESIPAPCNFLTPAGSDASPFGAFIPRWEGFEKMGIWMHETAGWAIYRWRGWVAHE